MAWNVIRSVAVLTAIGLALGSFIATIAVRWANGAPLFATRSHCDACHAGLSWHQTLPLISGLRTRWKCTRCGARISAIHIMGEVLMPVLALSAWWTAETSLEFTLLLVTANLLLLASLIDLQTQLLPRWINIVVGIFGLVFTSVTSPHSSKKLFELSFHNALWQNMSAAIAAFAAFTLINACYRRLRHRDGLGQGDAWLLAALGCWVGFAGLPWLLLGASMLALVAMILSSFFQSGHANAADTIMLSEIGSTNILTQSIPFGPFLSLAGWIVILWKMTSNL
jgi:leader peptidase (prepilin peptidase) / N-methyltransferase